MSSYVSSEEDESEIFHDIKEIGSDIVDDLAFVAQIVDLTKNSYYNLTTAGQAEDLLTIPTNVFPVANEESLGNDNDDDEDAFESEPEEVLGGEVEEEEAIPAGPLRTAHEIIDTPTHEKIHVEIPTYENIVHIGEIVSQISTEQTVVIKSIQTTTPLDEGSLLCFENREPFGIVNEIFGPLNQPFYVVKGISSSLLCREALGPVNNPTTEEGEVDVAITLAPGTKIYSPIG